MRNILMLFVVLLLIPTEVGAQQTAIDNGVSWLKGNQNPDGSWEGQPTSITTVFHTTSVVAETLQYLEVSDTTLLDAIQWIRDQDVVNTDYQ